MKGYLVVLFVNAAIFGFVAVASVGYGLLLDRTAQACLDAGGGDECQQSRDAARAIHRTAPFLLLIAVALFAAGYLTKPKRPEPPATTPATDNPGEPHHGR